MTWYVGRLRGWGLVLPAPCVAQGCELWFRWQDDAPLRLVQHGGDPLAPPSERVLEVDAGLSRTASLEQLHAWAERVHAYEEGAALAHGGPEP